MCGRVCTRPCEETCELGVDGDAVAIRALKRYASDYELARRPLKAQPCEIKYSEKIAIIGAGPAGLTAAVDLIRLGYPITVFEKEHEPGGMLRYAIPPYRLPDRILKREIDWIKGLGIDIKTHQKIVDPSTLFTEGYAAILFAGGAPKSFPLGIKGENAKGVFDALKILKEINENKSKKLNGNVIVIGGGSTAFDAARAALRLGAQKVTLAYRRGIQEMPADSEEIEAAQREGVEILLLTIPKKILTKDNVVIGITFQKTKLGKPDLSGRQRPELIQNSAFNYPADIIIPAIGAMPNIGHVGGIKVTTPQGVIDVADYGHTIVEGMFAAGDVEMGPSTVVDAIGRGHHAAKGIHAYLRRITASEPEKIFKGLQIYLGSKQCSTIKFPPKTITNVDPLTFDEVQGSYSDYEAVEEASRCFSCGPCYACPTCLPNCKNKQLIATIGIHTFLVKSPLELSYDITQKGPVTINLKVDGDTKIIKLHSLTAKVNPDRCIGCGRCEEVCAYRAIKNIINKDTRTLAEASHNACASCAACVSVCPAGAITQGYMSDDAILQRLTQTTTPYEGIKAFMSFWSTPSPIFGTYEGIIELMSSRKPSPSFLIRALAEAGRGLLIIKPDNTTGSHYLPWEEHPSDVLQNTWDLLQFIGISPVRIQYQDLPKNQYPSELLKKFAKKIEQQHLKKIPALSLESIASPLGKTFTLLKHLQSNPDTAPIDPVATPPHINKDGIAYFEGCLPLLSQLGIAQKLFDLTTTRQAIQILLKKIYPDIGTISSLSCPSQPNEKTKNNDRIIKQLHPQKIIFATPEAYTSFTHQHHTTVFTTLPKELHTLLKTTKSPQSQITTIALHPACSLETDPFYQPTKELLKKIPGLTIIELPQKCGESKFEQINGDSKQVGLSLMKNATAHNADLILCTSPYCESHLHLCQREGSWRSVDISIGNLYTFLNTILGDNVQ